ncbi:MAG: hypothetical protein PVI88_00225 [Nitrosopumilaceae archaeon]|jgi:hypothetical protein
MHETKLQKYTAYLETSLVFLINELWLAPEKMGAIVAECSSEAIKGIFGNKNGRGQLNKDWLQRFEDGFAQQLCDELKQYAIKEN